MDHVLKSQKVFSFLFSREEAAKGYCRLSCYLNEILESIDKFAQLDMRHMMVIGQRDGSSRIACANVYIRNVIYIYIYIYQ